MCHISVKLLQGLCSLCVHAHHLTDPLEAQAWMNLGLISTSDLEHQPLSFVSFACFLYLVVYTSVSFFSSLNDCFLPLVSPSVVFCSLLLVKI